MVRDSVLMDGVCVGEGARAYYSIIDEGSVLGRNSRVGAERGDEARITVVGAKSTIAEDEVFCQ